MPIARLVAWALARVRFLTLIETLHSAPSPASLRKRRRFVGTHGTQGCTCRRYSRSGVARRIPWLSSTACPPGAQTTSRGSWARNMGCVGCRSSTATERTSRSGEPPFYHWLNAAQGMPISDDMGRAVASVRSSFHPGTLR